MMTSAHGPAFEHDACGFPRSRRPNGFGFGCTATLDGTLDHVIL